MKIKDLSLTNFTTFEQAKFNLDKLAIPLAWKNHPILKAYTMFIDAPLIKISGFGSRKKLDY
jgi:hypothetical protein